MQRTDFTDRVGGMGGGRAGRNNWGNVLVYNFVTSEKSLQELILLYHFIKKSLYYVCPIFIVDIDQ